VDCHNCGKRGHIAAVCRSKKKPPKSPRNKKEGKTLGTKYVATETEQEPGDSKYLPLHAVEGNATPPIKVSLLINGTVHSFELDTGAAVTIISDKTCKELLPNAQLKKSGVLLKTYSGERIPVVGDVDIRVQYEQQTHKLALTVVAGEGPSLLGRNWLQHLKLNWREIKAVTKHRVGGLDYLLEKYGDIFSNELGI